MHEKKTKKRRTKQRDREKTHATTNKRTNEQNAVRTSLCWKRFSHNLVIALRWILYWLLVLSVYIIAVSLNRFEQPYVTYIVFALRKKWQYERETFFFSTELWAMWVCRVHISIYFRFIPKLSFKMETFPIEMAIIIWVSFQFYSWISHFSTPFPIESIEKCHLKCIKWNKMKILILMKWADDVKRAKRQISNALTTVEMHCNWRLINFFLQ